MEDRQKIIEKLVKIKALAERGIGGEQQTAQVMYATLKEKYKVTDAEIEKAAAVPVDISEREEEPAAAGEELTPED